MFFYPVSGRYPNLCSFLCFFIVIAFASEAEPFQLKSVGHQVSGRCFCRILLSGAAATLPLYCCNLLVIRASSMLIYRRYVQTPRLCQKRAKMRLQRTFSRNTALTRDWCLTPSHVPRDCVKRHQACVLLRFSECSSFTQRPSCLSRSLWVGKSFGWCSICGNDRNGGNSENTKRWNAKR